MNKQILFVMRSLDNPDLFTQEEKEENNRNAYTAATYTDADAYADAAADAAATYAAAYASAAAYAASTQYWVKKFFESSGEDKQTYIDEVERLKEDEVERLKEDEVERLKAGDRVKFSEAAKMLQGLDPYGIYTVAKTERSFVYLDISDTEHGCWYESDFKKIGDTKHIHHDLMIQYAKDTSIEIEVMETHYGWGVTIQPAWDTDREYRIKPKPERKPFNIEEALAGKRVVTTEGDEVTQLTQFKTLSYPDNIYGVVKGAIMSWNDDGSYSRTSDIKSLYMEELN